MTTKLKKGDTVRQVITPPIEGVITGFAVDQETGDVHAHVEWLVKDANGDEHKAARYFAEDQLEAAGGRDGPLTSAMMT